MTRPVPGRPSHLALAKAIRPPRFLLTPHRRGRGPRTRIKLAPLCAAGAPWVQLDANLPHLRQPLANPRQAGQAGRPSTAPGFCHRASPRSCSPPAATPPTLAALARRASGTHVDTLRGFHLPGRGPVRRHPRRRQAATAPARRPGSAARGFLKRAGLRSRPHLENRHLEFPQRAPRHRRRPGTTCDPQREPARLACLRRPEGFSGWLWPAAWTGWGGHRRRGR